MTTSDREPLLPWEAVRNQCVQSIHWHDEEGWKARTDALVTILTRTPTDRNAGIEEAADAGETLGHALFALSDKLRTSGFLADDASHAAYEEVVAAFRALDRALASTPPPADEHPLAHMVRLDEEMGLYDGDEVVPPSDTLSGPQQLDYAGEKLPVGAPRDPIELPIEADVETMLSRKWLDPECLHSGCQSLVHKRNYEAAVRGRQDFRRAFREARATIARLREAGDAMAFEAAQAVDGCSPMHPLRQLFRNWKEATNAN